MTPRVIGLVALLPTPRTRSRRSAAQDDFDPDPAARADGIARQLRFLEELGFTASRHEAARGF